MGMAKIEVHVDLENRTLSIAKTFVVSVCAHDKEIDISFDGDWALRLRDDKLERLTRDCQEQIAKNRMGKGAGKSK